MRSNSQILGAENPSRGQPSLFGDSSNEAPLDSVPNIVFIVRLAVPERRQLPVPHFIGGTTLILDPPRFGSHDQTGVARIMLNTRPFSSTPTGKKPEQTIRASLPRLKPRSYATTSDMKMELADHSTGWRAGAWRNSESDGEAV